MKSKCTIPYPDYVRLHTYAQFQFTSALSLR